MTNFIPNINFERLYGRFDAPITEIDCGAMCAPHNPSGKPFCCDICHAVPVAYTNEWVYLQPNTDLWHEWRGDECAEDPSSPEELRDQTPPHMLLLACKGPTFCQRSFRSMSCRQFPFFPYISSNDRFLGLAYDWRYEQTCWVISNLGRVSEVFRRSFIQVYDELLAIWPADYDSYAGLSEEMREVFSANKRRIPLLHRSGGFYLISPGSERMQRVAPEKLRRFGPYQEVPLAG